MYILVLIVYDRNLDWKIVRWNNFALYGLDFFKTEYSSGKILDIIFSMDIVLIDYKFDI